MTITILTPGKNQRQKSFYGKAKVIKTDDGAEILQSYSSYVLKRYPNGKLVRMWKAYSATTGRHLIAFANIGKQEFESLEFENPPLILI